MTDVNNDVTHNVNHWDNFDVSWRERGHADALDDLEAQLTSKPDTAENEYAWAWRRARLEHFRAMQHLDANRQDEARLAFERAGQHGQSAAKLFPTRVEGRFWAGACLLEAARAKGSLAVMRALTPSQAHLNAAVKLEEGFHFGGPLRVLGRVTHLKPLIAGGSLDNAIAFYIRARQLWPHNSTTLLYLAEALNADRQPGEAKRVLRELLNAPDDLDWTWEQARDRKLAAKLLEEIG